jgi:hypothetical protein
LEQAIQDQINALEELKRDAKRGKLKWLNLKTY